MAPIVFLLCVSRLVSRGPKQIFAEPGTAPAERTMCSEVADPELTKHMATFHSQARAGWEKDSYPGSGEMGPRDHSFFLL